jgi:hypothetical protein
LALFLTGKLIVIRCLFSEYPVKILRVFYGQIGPAQQARIRAENDAMRSRKPCEEQVILWITTGHDTCSIMECTDSPWVVRARFTSFFEARKWFVEYLNAVNPEWLHCHNFYSVYLAWLSSSQSVKSQIIYEIHGTTTFEKLHRNRNIYEALVKMPFFYLAEVVAPLLAHKLMPVSDRLTKYYPTLRLRPRVCIPRYVLIEDEKAESSAYVELSKQIAAYRRNGHKVVVYSGGTSKWQMCVETIKLMGRLAEMCNYRCVVLTGDPRTFRSMLYEHAVNAESFTVVALQKHEVISALKLCDLGLLLRDDYILNEVASPTKLYEYLYAGLAIVVTPAVPEERKLLRKQVLVLF